MKYIYFGATWCAPCTQIKPLVLSSKKQIQILDVGDPLAKKYNIKSVPTIIGLDGENVSEFYVGSSMIKSFLSI